MFKFWKNWRRQRLVNKYIKVGIYLGDGLSYMPLLELVDFDKTLAKFAALEKKYADFGYRTIPLADFVRAGGYEEDIDNLICVRRRKGEQVIYHALDYMADEVTCGQNSEKKET